MHSLTLLELLEQCISEQFYDQLRSKQQLGYSVSCGVRQTYGMLGKLLPPLNSYDTGLAASTLC